MMEQIHALMQIWKQNTNYFNAIKLKAFQWNWSKKKKLLKSGEKITYCTQGMPHIVHRTITSNFASKFPNHAPMCHQIEEWKKDRGWLLNAQNPLEWPFTVKLWHTPFSCNKYIGCSPHAMVIAFIVACPKKNLIENVLFQVWLEFRCIWIGNWILEKKCLVYYFFWNIFYESWIELHSTRIHLGRICWIPKIPAVQLLYKHDFMQFWKNWLRSPADDWAHCKLIQSTTKPMTIFEFASILGGW